MFTINVLICTRLQFDSNFLQSKFFLIFYIKVFKISKLSTKYVEVANVLQYSRNPFSNEFNLNDLETYSSF
jgi:hypothetical protein